MFLHKFPVSFVNFGRNLHMFACSYTILLNFALNFLKHHPKEKTAKWPQNWSQKWPKRPPPTPSCTLWLSGRHARGGRRTPSPRTGPWAACSSFQHHWSFERVAPTIVVPFQLLAFAFIFCCLLFLFPCLCSCHRFSFSCAFFVFF